MPGHNPQNNVGRDGAEKKEGTEPEVTLPPQPTVDEALAAEMKRIDEMAEEHRPSRKEVLAMLRKKGTVADENK